MIERLLILLALAGMVAALTVWYRRRSEADESLGAVDTETGGSRWPALPPQLQTDHKATWIIFSTPFCASCSTVQAQVEAAFPHHHVQKIDATERPDLANLYEVRRAPTTIVADVNGTIVERLVGPEAVVDFIGAAEDPVLADDR